MIVAGIACVGAVISALYSYDSRNREMDIELVKVGIGILRADPKESQTIGAREWAIQIIEKYSGQPFSTAAKKELLENSLGWVSTSYIDTYTPGDFSSKGSFGDRDHPKTQPATGSPQSK